MKNDRLGSDNVTYLSGNNVRDRYSRDDLRTYIQNNPDIRPLFLHYLSRLWGRYGSLKLTVLGDLAAEDRVPLPKVYVASNVTRQVHISRGKDGTPVFSTPLIASEDSHLNQRILAEFSHLPRYERFYTRPITALEMLECNPRLVLVGPAGSGKSTFAQFVTLCMAGEVLGKADANLKVLNGGAPAGLPESWPHGVFLPICIELRLFARSKHFPSEGTVGKVSHLLEYITSTLLPGRDPDLRAHLQQRIGGTILILDGLDEIAEAGRNRERVREVITDLVQCYPHCRILVTSRPYAYRDSGWRLDHAGFHEAMLAELSESQIDEFVQHWYRHLKDHLLVDDDLATERANELIVSIEQLPYLGKLAANPLLLTMLVGVNERCGGQLPMDRSQLYEETVKLLLDRWNRQRGLGTSVVSDDLGTDPRTVREKLEEVAFGIHQEYGTVEGAADITYDRLHEALKDIAGESKIPVRQIMDYLHQRSGILIADGPTLFRFPHRSFQEFLAACHLLGRDDYPNFVAKLAIESPGKWREVLLFVAARAMTFRHRDVWELAAELCPPGPVSDRVPQEADWQSLLLAGLVLVGTGLPGRYASRRYQTTLAHIREWLVICIERGAMAVLERIEAGWILGCIGDSRPGVGLREDGVPDIEWVEIPAGPFLMGSTDADVLAFGNEMPQQEVTLDTYYVSKYPITIAQFREYIMSDEYPHHRRAETQRRWQKEPKSSADNHPMVGVSWSEAIEFCEWLGNKLGYEIRLPTEEEWEKAARGTDGRIYPWGNELDSNLCNVDGRVGRTCAVGLFPKGASPYGVMDMSGNAWEWTSSFWQADYGAPIGIGTFHEVRGGSFGDAPKVARCAYHGKEATDGLLVGQGFRVATSHRAEQE